MAIRFRCSQCRALMQVDDLAAGKKAQCPKCASIESVPHHSQPTSAGSSSPVSSSPGSPPSPNWAPPAAPRKSAGPSSPSPADNLKSIRCPHCRQLSRALPGARVQCPHCKKSIQTPGGAAEIPTGNATGPSGAAGPSGATGQGRGPNRPASPVSPWANVPTSFPASPPQPSPAPSYQRPVVPASPYAPTGHYASQPSYYPSGYAPDRRGQYTTIGAFYCIAGGLTAIYTAFQLVVVILQFTLNRQEVDTLMENDGDPVPLGFAIAYIVFDQVVSWTLAIVFLSGGVALCRQSNLLMARVATVVALIPVINFCCLLYPFSIWAACILFSGQAQHDFRRR